MINIKLLIAIISVIFIIILIILITIKIQKLIFKFFLYSSLLIFLLILWQYFLYHQVTTPKTNPLKYPSCTKKEPFCQLGMYCSDKTVYNVVHTPDATPKHCHPYLYPIFSKLNLWNSIKKSCYLLQPYFAWLQFGKLFCLSISHQKIIQLIIAINNVHFILNANKPPFCSKLIMEVEFL